MQRQEVYVPANDQVSSYTSWAQYYSYDALNRLTQVHESTGNSLYDWQQSYRYDMDSSGGRYGNRTIDQANTYGAGIPNITFTADGNTNRLGVPAGQSGTMGYDAAGNLTQDSYTGAGSRTFDAENRMVTAAEVGGMSRYGYDPLGKRVRRNGSGQAVWQVYGIDGDLSAEYIAGALPSMPLKEYGYRDVQLLVTASNTAAINFALSGTATQSSTFVNGGQTFSASRAIDNNTDGAMWNGHASVTNYGANSWWQEDLGSSRQLTSIQVWGRTDCCPEMTSNFYVFVSDLPFTSTDLTTTINQAGVSNYYVSGASGNPSTVAVNRTGRYIRVQFSGSQYLVLAEVQAWGPQAQSADVEWLVSDQLGTPRMTMDLSGSLSGVKRHDYLPFGEELSAGTGLRSSAQGYVNDGIRQKFTQKERDSETGLDYFGARYFSSAQGRFTSADTVTGSQFNPQTFNLYAYVNNNPLRFTDSTGHTATEDHEQGHGGDAHPFGDNQGQQPPQPPPPPTVPPPSRDSLPGSPDYQAQIPRPDVTVTADPPVQKPNVATGNGRYLTGIMSIITVRFTNDSGQPMQGLSVMETNTVISAEPQQPFAQNTGVVTTDGEGSMYDAVSGGGYVSSSPLTSPDQVIGIYQTQIENRVNVVSEQTLIVAARGYVVVATVTYQRTISNLDEQGQLRPGVNSAGKHFNNFSINITTPSVSYPTRSSP